MTKSESFKRGECKLRYLRVLEAKRKEIEKQERRCLSMSSTVEEFRKRVETIRAERDKLEEECRSKIDPDELQKMMSFGIKGHRRILHDIDLRCLPDTEILIKLFLNSVACYTGFLTFAGSGFRASKKDCSMSGPLHIIDVARSLGCEVRGNWKEALESYDLQSISDFWVELLLQIVEAKRTQKVD